VKLRFFG